ncbi:MAG: hypothetical protein AAF490_28745 [Chloroflexota bacterium]
MYKKLFLLVLLIFLISCANGTRVEETAVLTPTTLAPQPSPSSTPLPTTTALPPTETAVLPTQTSTRAHITSVPSPTQVPPSATPTVEPSLLWTNKFETVTVLDSSTIYWSPMQNEFVVFCNPYPNPAPEISAISLYIAPEFSEIDITSEHFSCTIDGGFGAQLIWHPDGQKLFFNGQADSEEYFPSNTSLLSMNRQGTDFQVRKLSSNFQNFNGWMNESKLVFRDYFGGGHHVPFIFDITNNTILASSIIHAGNVFGLNEQFIVVGTGQQPDFNYTVAAFSESPVIPLEIERYEGPYLFALSVDMNETGWNLRYSSAPLDWIPQTGEALALTWDTDVSLTNVDLGHEQNVTSLQIWDVAADAVVDEIPNGVDGAFSPNGRFLAYLTPDTPAPNFHLLDRTTDQIQFSIPVFSERNIYLSTLLAFSPNSRYLILETPGVLHTDANQSPQFVGFSETRYLHMLDLETMAVVQSMPALGHVSWSPNGQMFTFLNEDENLAVFDVTAQRAMPIRVSGGRQLVNPQWSFDGSYLSVAYRDEANVWQTAVLQISKP